MSKAIQNILDHYPAAVFRNRKEHILEKGGDKKEIAANSRTIPGIITSRGCCYAGCKGVVLGPLQDVAVIVHGPVGCSYYAWGTRRNKAKGRNGRNFVQYCLTTDMQESDIVFGGVKKLTLAIEEAVELFHPAAVMIASTCPVGLIGDDIHAVAAEAEKKYGISVTAYSCEGYKGVSQSGGHHIANNGLISKIIGKGDMKVEDGKFRINILGEYNIGGDGWEIGRILKKIGYEVISVMTGDGAYEELVNAHAANLNVVQCHRSINYIGEMMRVKYGTDWVKVNFIGIDHTVKSLRDMAKYFADEALIQRTEEVIAEEVEDIADDFEQYRKILNGKKAVLYVGGSRAHHYQNLLKSLGVTTVMAGYEFAHRDDYEGREVISTIKEDADSKNIQELKIEKDPEKFKMRLSQEEYDKLSKEIPLNYYAGMIKDMPDGSIVIDDLNHIETEEFIKMLKPDIFFSGIKDKFVAQKAGVLSRQLHSYDYGGPYAGFRGCVNFAKDVAMGITTPTWSYIVAPWKKEPKLTGEFAGGNQ
ncbi:MAG: nitrogenase component I subunit alpha [Endomicrobium sp.]|jgi:nitrogenase molybdenum-iron protein alpha chain|nr:nitrogenase component I subunit alpha [Endomicrobium sp.]